MKKLSEIQKGQIVEIIEVKNNEIYLKLIEMGFLPGEKIYIENIAPMGDPISVNIFGNIVCIRLNEAENIYVK